MMSAVNSWFAIRLDIVSVLVMLVLTLFCVLYRDHADPIILSLLVTYSLQIQNNLYYLLKCYMWLEQQMVSVTRCFKILEIANERTNHSLDIS